MPNICGKNFGPGKKISSFRSNCCGKQNTISEPGIALKLPCKLVVFDNKSASPIPFTYINCAGGVESEILPEYQVSYYCGSQPKSPDPKVEISIGNDC